MRPRPLGPSVELPWGHEVPYWVGEEGMMLMMLMMGGERRRDGQREVSDAGRCLFKTRTQHHRMVGGNINNKKNKQN